MNRSAIRSPYAALALVLPLSGCLGITAAQVGMLAGGALGTAALMTTSKAVLPPDPIAPQPSLVALCREAMVLAPAAPEIAPWIVAGCGTAEALVTLAADPSSSNWVRGLIAKTIPQRR